MLECLSDLARDGSEREREEEEGRKRTRGSPVRESSERLKTVIIICCKHTRLAAPPNQPTSTRPQVELQTSSAISEMEEATKKIKEEVFKRYEEAGKLIKEETMQKAKDAIIVKYAELEPELLAKIEEEGPDAAARHRAREVMEKKIKVLQDELNNEHKKGLENGALERLNEREQQLADQRIEVQQRLDEETRERMSELSAKLSADAKVQISTYRIELEDLRESRVTAARAKENEITDKELQKVKEKFMQQATEEVGLCQIGAKEEEEAMLAGIKEEVKRYQELRAAEITTQARTVRAQALPSMAIELEERAEAIERQYRMGLIAEDTHEETEAISSSVVELKKHVFGAREAVFSDNEQFVRDITVSWGGLERSEAKRKRSICGDYWCAVNLQVLTCTHPLLLISSPHLSPFPPLYTGRFPQL